MNIIIEKKISGILVCILLVILICSSISIITETTGESIPIWYNGICEEGETAENCPEDCRFRFGTEYVAMHRDTGIPELFADAGIHYSKIAGMPWGAVETRPPTGNIHYYDWSVVDPMIMEYQKNNYDLQIVLFPCCCYEWKPNFWPMCWAIESPPVYTIYQPGTPPKEDYWDDYALWVQEVVERYDNDGYNDMPGLTRPILQYEILSEATHQGFWQVPQEQDRIVQYKKLLELSYNAAKSANSDAKIILSGLNFGVLFDDIPDDDVIDSRISTIMNNPVTGEFMTKAFDFTWETLSYSDYYDFIEFHYNQDYKGAYGTVDYIRRYSDKPIWGGDTVMGPMLFTPYALLIPEIHFYPNAIDIYDAIDNSNNVHHKDVLNWYRAEMAMQAFKKCVVGMDIGLEGENLGNHIDWPWYEDKNFKYQGMADYNISANKVKSPRSAYYAVKQVIDKLGKYTDIERLNIGGDVLQNHGIGAWVFKFSVNDKPIYVLWYDRGVYECPICEVKEHGNTTVDLSSYISTPNVKITHIVTERDSGNNPIYPPDEIVPTNSIYIDETPVFVEETSVSLYE